MTVFNACVLPVPTFPSRRTLCPDIAVSKNCCCKLFRLGLAASLCSVLEWHTSYRPRNQQPKIKTIGEDQRSVQGECGIHQQKNWKDDDIQGINNDAKILC